MTPDGAAATRVPAAAPAVLPGLPPSVCKALAATLPSRVALRGARSVGAAWQTWVSWQGGQAGTVQHPVALHGGRAVRGHGKCSRHALLQHPLTAPCLQVHYSGQQTFVGRLSRQAAAVAADIVLVWQQHCLTPKTAEKVGGLGGMGQARATEAAGKLPCSMSAQCLGHDQLISIKSYMTGHV